MKQEKQKKIDTKPILWTSRQNAYQEQTQKIVIWYSFAIMKTKKLVDCFFVQKPTKKRTHKHMIL